MTGGARGGGARGWALVAPALLWTLALFLVPLGAMAVQSLGVRVAGRPVPGWSLGNYARFLERAYFHEALLNSLEVTAVVAALSLLLAYPLAWVIAFRVPGRGQRVALVLRSCRSGPPTWCAPTAGCSSWRRTASCRRRSGSSASTSRACSSRAAARAR